MPEFHGLPRSTSSTSFGLFRITLIFIMVWSPLSAATKPSASTVLCPISEYIDVLDKTVSEFFQCPGAEDPPDHVQCCEDKCCVPSPNLDSVLQVDLRIAMIISLTVILICLLAGMVIIVCCFVSSCPLYEMCTSSGGWTVKADEAGLPFSWATEYVEVDQGLANGSAGVVVVSAASNSSASSSDNNKNNHRIAEKVDAKDIEAAEHV